MILFGIVFGKQEKISVREDETYKRVLVQKEGTWQTMWTINKKTQQSWGATAYSKYISPT
jgi:hypothetical protein